MWLPGNADTGESAKRSKPQQGMRAKPFGSLPALSPHTGRGRAARPFFGPYSLLLFHLLKGWNRNTRKGQRPGTQWSGIQIGIQRQGRRSKTQQEDSSGKCAKCAETGGSFRPERQVLRGLDAWRYAQKPAGLIPRSPTVTTRSPRMTAVFGHALPVGGQPGHPDPGVAGFL